jgi:hypothetical protein
MATDDAVFEPMPDLNQQERLALVAGLKHAVSDYYRIAWMIYGPNGSRPDPLAHAMLMRIGNDLCEIGRKFGDPMD